MAYRGEETTIAGRLAELYRRVRQLEMTLRPGLVSRHAQLEGLDADDHAQYLTSDRAASAISAAIDLVRAEADPFPQYLTEEDGDALYAPIGSGGGGVTDHGLLTGLDDDDHTQYLTNERGDLRYDLLGAGVDAVDAHVAEPDPHAQYLTADEAAALYDALGSAAGAIFAHLASVDPHPQYLTPAEGAAAYDTIGSAAAALATALTALGAKADKPTAANPQWGGKFKSGQLTASSGSSATTNINVNRLFYVPVDFSYPGTIQRTAIIHGAVQPTTGIVRLGLYASGPDGLPLTLLNTFTSFDLTTAPAFKILPASFAITSPGRYWWGFVGQWAAGFNPTFAVGGTSGTPVPSVDNVSNGTKFEAAAGALPATATPGVSNATSAPLVFVDYAG